MSQENDHPCQANKSVQFSRFIKISFTYPGDEYDRSALEPAKLTFSEATELMQLRIDWKQEMNRRLEQQQQQQQQLQQQDSEDDYSSSDEARVPGSSPSSSSMAAAVSSSARSVLKSSLSRGSSAGLSHHQGLSRGTNSGCSSPVSEGGEFTFGQAHHHGSSAMMHRHNELHQSKENMSCLA
ncbi:hypothetical protein BGZ54_008970 [Gamsiella multidivaricata]|nr:hypothetical protein BGZ54_008970 [Gamsiella multidivaricata]